MSIETEIVTLLQADTDGMNGVADLLTGGIYAKSQIGKMGIDKNNSATSSAYVVANGYPALQPLVVVRLRSLVPQGNRHDRNNQHAGARGTLELWFYDENNYTTIESARDRAYTLLQAKTIANVGLLSLDNRLLGQRAQDLNDAALLRDDYTITQIIGA